MDRLAQHTQNIVRGSAGLRRETKTQDARSALNIPISHLQGGGDHRLLERRWGDVGCPA
jgi:hypothetical protein